MRTKALGNALAAGWMVWGAVALAQSGFDGGNNSGFGNGGSSFGKSEAKTVERPALFNPQIDQLYRQAVQMFHSRRYDDAEALCQRILTIKTNELNTVNLLREIGDMRARVPAYDPGAAMKRRLQEIKLPNFKAVDVEVRDLIEPLQKASASSAPEKLPVNLLWQHPAGEKIPRVTFDLHNVTLAEVLYYVTYRNGLTYRVDENAVVVGKDLPPSAVEDGGMSPLKRKLRETILPEVRLATAQVQDAMSLLQSLAVKHAADQSGFNAVWQVPSEVTIPPVSLTLYRVSLGDALRYVCELAGLRYQTEERAVVIYPAEPPTAATSAATK